MKFEIPFLCIVFSYWIFAEDIRDTTLTEDSVVVPESSPDNSTFTAIDTSGMSISSEDSLPPLDTLPADSLTRSESGDTLVKRLSTEALPADSSRMTDTTAIDTSYRAWHFPYFGIGIGWAPGSYPLFEVWQDGLETETKINEIILSTLLPDSILTVSIIEPPAPYTVVFPVYLSFTPLVTENHSLTFSTSYFWIRKTFLASYALDTLSVSYIEDRLSIKNVSLGVKYHVKIPDTYFKISTVENTCITVGFNGSPLIVLRQWRKLTGLPEWESNSYGIGVGWVAGMTTFKKLGEKNGLEIGFTYNGSWNGRFVDPIFTGNHLLRGHINPFDTHYNEAVEFITHRFLLHFSILIGRKNYRKETQTSTVLPEE